MPRFHIIASVLVVWFLTTSVAGQQAAPARVALVVGNSAYREAPLRNPVNDARAMSVRLGALGFEVISIENADRSAMEQAILNFAARLRSETTGLFYYAGHGIQSRGHNYLVPVDASVDSERELRFEALDVNSLLEEMEFAGNKMNIVILDACRNNPFERRLRGGSRGLAAIDAARGILIAYATAPGALAADGDGENGLYTAELLDALEVPNLKAEEVFKRVRVAVSERTRGAQVPWESSSLTGDFVFNKQVSTGPAASAWAPPSAPSGSHEALFWETVKDSKNPEDFRAYLQQYPQGSFASLAQIRISSLETKSRIVESRVADDGRLKVALLPFAGWHGGGKLTMALENMEQGVTRTIQADKRLQLVYAEAIGDVDRFWEGSTMHRTPKAEVLIEAGRQLGADVVLTYFLTRTKMRIYVAAYLFDIRDNKKIKRDVKSDTAGGHARILTQQLIDELFAGGG